MVYNAMKLFMDINPQLFDDCMQEYKEHQSGADEREKSRQQRWDLVVEQAEKRKNGCVPPQPSLPTANSGKAEEIDPITQDSQKRLNALKLDESATPKEKTSNSVSHT